MENSRPLDGPLMHQTCQIPDVSDTLGSEILRFLMLQEEFKDMKDSIFRCMALRERASLETGVVILQ